MLHDASSGPSSADDVRLSQDRPRARIAPRRIKDVRGITERDGRAEWSLVGVLDRSVRCSIGARRAQGRGGHHDGSCLQVLLRTPEEPRHRTVRGACFKPDSAAHDAREGGTWKSLRLAEAPATATERRSRVLARPGFAAATREFPPRRLRRALDDPESKSSCPADRVQTDAEGVAGICGSQRARSPRRRSRSNRAAGKVASKRFDRLRSQGVVAAAVVVRLRSHVGRTDWCENGR